MSLKFLIDDETRTEAKADIKGCRRSSSGKEPAGKVRKIAREASARKGPMAERQTRKLEAESRWRKPERKMIGDRRSHGMDRDAWRNTKEYPGRGGKPGSENGF